MKCCYYIDMLLLQAGRTPLHNACWRGHLEIVEFLINKEADISATDNVSDYVVAMFMIIYNLVGRGITKIYAKQKHLWYKESTRPIMQAGRRDQKF